MAKLDLTKFKGVLFDLDGTLVETCNIWDNAFETMLLKYGAKKRGRVVPDIWLDFINKVKDTAVQGTLAEAFAQHLMDLHDIKGVSSTDFHIETEEEVVRRIADVPYKKGAPELLLWLKANGFKIGLVTMSPAMAVRSYQNNPNINKLAPFKSIFDITITGDSVRRRKPDPEPYLIAMEKLGLEPHECLVFEDSIEGTLSATRAGVTVCVVHDAGSDAVRDELRKLTPYHINCYSEVL